MAEARTGSGSGKSGSRRPRETDASRADGAPGAGGQEQGGGAPRTGMPVCPVAFCPVGMALTFAEAARPEVVQHLMAAGHELLLAVKAVIDARAEAVGGESGLERITIR